jgi:hypothetical protein
MTNKLKLRVVGEWGNILFASGKHVVDTENIMPLFQKVFCQMATYKTSASGYNNGFHFMLHFGIERFRQD